MQEMIKNTAFIIPDAIRVGVENGNYNIIGGVVRDNSGRIIKFLEEVINENKNKTKELPAKIIIPTGIALLIATGTLLVCKKISKERNKEIMNQVISVEHGIKTYYVKGSNYTLEKEDIESLIKALETLISNSQFKHLETNKKLYDNIKEFTSCVNINNSNLARVLEMPLTPLYIEQKSSNSNMMNIAISGLKSYKELLEHE